MEEYVSLNFLKSKYIDWKAYILRHKYAVIGVWVLCIGLSFSLMFVIPRKYTAKLSFALQTDEAGGGLADLASQFGVNLGGGGMGAFGGDNLFSLLISRNMIERALLAPQTIDGKATNLLNRYISAYKMDKAWAQSSESSIKNLSFPLTQDRSTFTRVQDSVFLMITAGITKGQLIADKRSKKLSIGDLSFTSVDEQLSKRFLETLMEVTTDYYIKTKTKRAQENFRNLQHEVDSIRALYVAAVHGRAAAMDAVPNAVRQSSTASILERTTEMQYLAATYAELQKSLELARVSINSNAPLVDIIDPPILPLEVSKFGKLKAGVAGLFGGGMVTLFIFTVLFLYKSRNGTAPN